MSVFPDRNDACAGFFTLVEGTVGLIATESFPGGRGAIFHDQQVPGHRSSLMEVTILECPAGYCRNVSHYYSDLRQRPQATFTACRTGLLLYPVQRDLSFKDEVGASHIVATLVEIRASLCHSMDDPYIHFARAYHG